MHYILESTCNNEGCEGHLPVSTKSCTNSPDMSSKYDDDDDGKDDGDYGQKQWRNSAPEKKDDGEEKETSKAIDDDELVMRVQEFFFADDTLTKTFEAFVKENAPIIDLESSEYKLEYTKVYNEFKAILEVKLERFIEDKLGATVQQFYLALKAKTEEDGNSNEAVFGQILLAVCDFDVFMTMMREEATATARK